VIQHCTSKDGDVGGGSDEGRIGTPRLGLKQGSTFAAGRRPKIIAPPSKLSVPAGGELSSANGVCWPTRMPRSRQYHQSSFGARAQHKRCNRHAPAWLSLPDQFDLLQNCTSTRGVENEVDAIETIFRAQWLFEQIS
jgi:hypothetical protein